MHALFVNRQLLYTFQLNFCVTVKNLVELQTKKNNEKEEELGV